jgi:hypothetical protein
MSAIADLVAHLVSTGIPPEAISRAIDLAQQHVKESVEIHRNSTGIPPDSTAERRRAYDRERKRKIAELAESSLSFLGVDKEEKKERAKRDRGHICPDDFRPSESHFEGALKRNISRPRVEACCEAMKSWSKSNAHRAVARKVDWSAALFGWIDREAERMGGNGSIVPKKSPII